VCSSDLALETGEDSFADDLNVPVPKTLAIWIIARPIGVVLSMPCWSQ